MPYFVWSFLNFNYIPTFLYLIFGFIEKLNLLGVKHFFCTSIFSLLHKLINENIKKSLLCDSRGKVLVPECTFHSYALFLLSNLGCGGVERCCEYNEKKKEVYIVGIIVVKSIYTIALVVVVQTQLGWYNTNLWPVLDCVKVNFLS